MSNVGRASVEQTVVASLDQTQVKTGGQPGQGLQHGYKKIVHSKPMDLTKVSQTNNPVNSDLFLTNAHSTIRGGRVMQTSIKDMSGVIIDSMD